MWVIWRPFGKVSRFIAGLFHIFTLLDWLLLWWLPKSGRSFGPIGPQLYVMAFPRIAVTLVTALFSKLSLVWGVIFFIFGQLAGWLCYLWGMLYEPFATTTTFYSFASPNIAPHGRRIRLLHLSDFHIERLTRRETDLLDQIAHIQPDVIVITGDYLNLSYVDEPLARAEAKQLLGQLSAPYGVYAVLGSPPADPRRTTPSLFDDTNIRLLRDEVAVLSFDDGQALSLMGLDCEHDLESDMYVFKQLFDKTPPKSTKILLYHSPELMPQVQQYPIELYLCGHTHGGQIRFPYYGALLTSSVTGKRYEMGPYTENNTTLYVSRGVGLEGLSAPRMRFLCQPEIILFTLVGRERS